MLLKEDNQNQLIKKYSKNSNIANLKYIFFYFYFNCLFYSCDRKAEF